MRVNIRKRKRGFSEIGEREGGKLNIKRENKPKLVQSKGDKE